MNKIIFNVSSTQQQIDSWKETIQKPLWFKTVMPVILDWWEQAKDLKEDEKDEVKELIYGFFEENLNKGLIKLADSGPDFDQWRKPIDQVVIHYTGGKPGVSWQRLSTIGLLRQYAHDYYKYDDIYGVPVEGQDIWSNHFKDGKQVFFAYHWIVRGDGSFERLLEDKYIGWQAGKGDTNFRSIAIVLDNEYLDQEPSIKEIEAIASILKNHYPQIEKDQVFGHLEVNPNTECPGNLFLPVWKEKLLKLL